MRTTVLATILFFAPSLVRADDRVMLCPGPGYRVSWSAGDHHDFDASPRVDRQGWSPVDRWFATAKRVYLRTGGDVKPLAEVAGVHSLSITPDGSALTWLADFGGAVVRNGKTTPLPTGTRSAHFRMDGGAALVLTTEDGILTWDSTDSAPKLVGGWSPDDAVNIAGDLLGGAAISFAYWKSGHLKKMQTPTTPDP